jgi:hypothetical protein
MVYLLKKLRAGTIAALRNAFAALQHKTKYRDRRPPGKHFLLRCNNLEGRF